MKKIILLLFLTVFIPIVYSQSINKIAGIYHLQSGSHDPQGGVKLILTPQKQYFIAYFGGMQHGTWEECDGNLIMQPDTTYQDAYYVSGYNNPDISKDSIHISFSGMAESTSLCSFDQEGKNSTLHPVFNKSPNCFGTSNVSLPKGKYNEISFMSSPQVFEDMEYDVENTPWKTALLNYLKSKNRSIQDTDTITGIKYTFPLTSAYNEYEISSNYSTGDRFIPPILGVFRGTKLCINDDVYIKSQDISSLSERDREFLKRYSSMSPTDMENAENEEVDEYSSPVHDKYKPVPYTRKKTVTVNYDFNNILTFTCYEYHKNQR